MKKITLLAAISFCIFFIKLHAQVGIGTATPNATALLQVDAGTSLTNGVLITGTSNVSATVPNLNAGSRLMFYPGKGAFRAGYVDGTQWNDSLVGRFSVAMGYNTHASGFNSTAMGVLTTASGYYSTSMGSSYTASGNYSTAMGDNTTASGDYSTSMGSYTKAIGDFSTAMGYSTTAYGNYSTAMGSQTTASGNGSTAMGSQTTAIGQSSTAMGYSTIASGDYSTAMGNKVSTNGQQGAFIIGDSDPFRQGQTTVGVPDQFVARFNQGYFFLTSGDLNRYGVSIPHYGNSWVSICDKNRKENFEPLNGEAILQKLSNINFTSWNYKMQDPKSYRHYGIMAQDFNTAFGKDKYGTIGNDTTVNPIDMIGIDMAAIQALVKRTNELKDKDEAINKKLAVVTELKKENENLRQSMAQLQTSLDEQQKVIAQSLQQMEALTIKQTTKEHLAIKK